MGTLKDQLIKLGFNPTTEAAEPAWGKGHGGGAARGGRAERGQTRGQEKGKGGAPSGARGGRKAGAAEGRAQERVHVPADPQERAAAIKALIKRARQPLPSPGPRRFYFQVGELIDYLDVDPSSYERLTRGAIGVTLDDAGRVIVLSGAALRELEALRAADEQP